MSLICFRVDVSLILKFRIFIFYVVLEWGQYPTLSIHNASLTFLRDSISIWGLETFSHHHYMMDTSLIILGILSTSQGHVDQTSLLFGSCGPIIMILGDISHFIPKCFGLTLEALQGLLQYGLCDPNHMVTWTQHNYFRDFFTFLSNITSRQLYGLTLVKTMVK